MAPERVEARQGSVEESSSGRVGSAKRELRALAHALAVDADIEVSSRRDPEEVEPLMASRSRRPRVRFAAQTQQERDETPSRQVLEDRVLIGAESDGGRSPG